MSLDIFSNGYVEVTVGTVLCKKKRTMELLKVNQFAIFLCIFENAFSCIRTVFMKCRGFVTSNDTLKAMIYRKLNIFCRILYLKNTTVGTSYILYFIY